MQIQSIVMKLLSMRLPGKQRTYCNITRRLRVKSGTWAFVSPGYIHYCDVSYKVKVKVKQSYYRPEQTHKLAEDWGSKISRQSTHEGGKVVIPTHRPPLTPQELFLVFICVRGWVNPRAIVRPEGLCQWKISVTTSGIDPATFRFVATACPTYIGYIFIYTCVCVCVCMCTAIEDNVLYKQSEHISDITFNTFTEKITWLYYTF
jgi:hypothetical protein